MTGTGEALEALLTHPGWQVFLEHVVQEWGANGIRYQTEMDNALNQTDDVVAASKARQIRAGRRTIELLVRWPAEEVARLKRLDEGPAAPNPSRRGGL